MSEKVTTEQKLQYQVNQKESRIKIKKTASAIDELETEINKSKNKVLNYYRNIAIANYYLDIVELFSNSVIMYRKIYGKHNEEEQKEAREAFFKALVSLEKVVGKYVAGPLTENAELLESLSRFNPKRKLTLIKKFENRLRDIKEAIGDNSRYKWAVIEIEGRFIAVAKNLMNFKELDGADPRTPYYAENQTLLHMIKEYLKLASQLYREKYTRSNKEPMDMKRAIAFQEALRSICIVLGTPQEAENSKKAIDAWNTLLDKEEKEKEKRKSRKKK